MYRPHDRGEAVAERLCHRLKHIGVGYAHCTRGLSRPIIILTGMRRLVIERSTGAIEEAPYDQD